MVFGFIADRLLLAVEAFSNLVVEDVGNNVSLARKNNIALSFIIANYTTCVCSHHYT